MGEHPSYHHSITGNEAKRRLQMHDRLGYLTRYSDMQQCYLLTVYKPTEVIKHFKIEIDGDMHKIEGKGKIFDSIGSLLAHYEDAKNTPLDPSFKTIGRYYTEDDYNLEEKKRKEEERKQTEAEQAQKRKQNEEREQAEKRRLEEEERKADEKRCDEERRQEQIIKMQEEGKRRQDELKLEMLKLEAKIEEEKRLAEEAKKQAEEEKRLAEEARRQAEEEKRRAEEIRLQLEQQQQVAEPAAEPPPEPAAVPPPEPAAEPPPKKSHCIIL